MNLCVKDKPLAVGLPVDIAEATQGSVKWQRHKKECADLKNNVIGLAKHAVIIVAPALRR